MSLEAQMKIAVILSAYDKMSKGVNDAVNKSQAKLNAFASKADAISNKAFNTGKQLLVAGLAVGAPIYKAIESAQEFETKMIGIRKQMQNDTPETVKLMTQQVMSLGRQLPLATADIQDMIASGLRMGIAEDKIIDYTKSVTKMSVAFDMIPAEIADSMGKIANVFKIPIEKVGDLADTINYLDDNTVAKGPELIDVLQRIGGSARALNPNAAAALASTMLSLGESAETSGSGISTMMNRLSAAQMQGKKFQTGMEMLGLSSAKLQKDMSNKDTAQNAMMQVFQKISELKPEKQTEALVRLFGTEHGPKLMKLVNNLGEFQRQLNLVNGMQKGSMDKEYQKRLESASAKWQIFKNKVAEVSVKIGNTLLPVFTNVVNKLGNIIDKISTFVDRNQPLVSGIGIAAAAFAGLSLVGSGLSFVIGGVAKFFSIASKILSYTSKAIGFVSKAFQLLRFVIIANPVIAIITGIAVAALIIYKYWDKIKVFFVNLWTGVKKVFTDFFDWISGIGERMYNAGKNIVLSIWNGIKSIVMKPVEAIKGMVKSIRNLLPFSPAKEGPLKDIHRIRLVETIAESVKPQSLVKKMGMVAQLSYNAIAKPSLKTGGIQGGNRAGGMSVSFNITLNGGATKSEAQLVTAEIKKQFTQLMKQYSNQQARVSF